ncbi:FolC bifunctional protein [Mollisia scopiformis]|uniref:Folylpolyglutamate synthase n=1 Tax=Mollisia scopiformis TaxID=149040 RepID=A0A194XUV1_MOLSC|nr:FolC bifunctional protein [Mollisia scopiformis]KUJ23916.1 FolC bifunctional protein [Mollisia scopiformis]
MTSAVRTYADALKLLEKLQSNRQVRSAFSKTSGDMNLQAIPEMLDWTRRAGYDVRDLAKHGLKYIHVAGTKGKGSVCVMVESILLQYQSVEKGVGLGKIGLYTSPHLVHVRERIRIDGSPISEPLFAKYFFELWDKFSATATLDSNTDPQSLDTKPSYFRYLTLLAFHTFIREGVQSAIVECGIGGEYDSTNMLPAEAVTATAITPLAIDHAGMLGDTIEDIAWHKAGIMKTGVLAYTANQALEAQAVLDRRAAEKGVELTVVNRLPLLDERNIKLGLDGDFQRDNASLAIVVASSHLRTMGISNGVPSPQPLIESPETLSLPEKFIKGLTTAIWPGRCQFVKDGNTEWFIDGAHTKESLEAAAAWFARRASEAFCSSKPPNSTMLIFNQQDRDAGALMKGLMASLYHNKNSPWYSTTTSQQPIPLNNRKLFLYAAFVTNEPFKPAIAGTIDTALQTELAKLYTRLDANQLFMVYESVEEAVDLAHKISEGNERVLVFVTGSLHLVGSVLKVLEKKGVDVTVSNQAMV